MILRVFTVYDSAVEAYFRPFFFEKDAQALRAFADLSNDPKSHVCNHPQDFSLFYIGDYDDSKGEITPQPMLVIGKGHEVKGK